MVDDAETPTWEQIIQEAMDDRLLDVHVALPGKVAKVYDDKPTRVDVKPMIRAVLEEEDTGEFVDEELPVIPSVPVTALRAGDFFVSMPIKVGDTGQLLFNERSIDRFRATGEDVPPGDNRMHSLNGAVFIPTGLGKSADDLADAHPDNLVVGRDGGCAIHIRPDDQIHLGSDGAADFVALAALVTTQLAAIASAFNGHIHPGVTPGIGVTGAPGPAPTGLPSAVITPGPVASSKVKAD